MHPKAWVPGVPGSSLTVAGHASGSHTGLRRPIDYVDMDRNAASGLPTLASGPAGIVPRVTQHQPLLESCASQVRGLSTAAPSVDAHLPP